MTSQCNLCKNEVFLFVYFLCGGEKKNPFNEIDFNSLTKKRMCHILGVFSASNHHCLDIYGKVFDHGMHYVPGPEQCKICICDNGHPTTCKVVLCSPPLDCKSFQSGNQCCEFICMDDTLANADRNSDFGI